MENELRRSFIDVLSAVTGIVGAYFGVHVGSSGKEEAITARNDSEQTSRSMALLVNPTGIDKEKAQEVVNQSLNK